MKKFLAKTLEDAENNKFATYSLMVIFSVLIVYAVMIQSSSERSNISVVSLAQWEFSNVVQTKHSMQANRMLYKKTIVRDDVKLSPVEVNSIVALDNQLAAIQSTCRQHIKRFEELSSMLSDENRQKYDLIKIEDDACDPKTSIKLRKFYF